MNDFVFSALLLGALSTDARMPFWEYANQYDIMPVTSGAVTLIQAGTQYDESKTVQWKWGAGAAVRTDNFRPVEFFPDELFASVKWKALSLDLGMKRCRQDFTGADPSLGSLSTTAGNVERSGNSRSWPGYSINIDRLNIPFTKGHLQLTAAFGDYKTTDIRYMKGAMVHNTALYLTGLFGRFDITLGLDHWALWGGTSPDGQKMPSSFKDYIRVVLGKSADANGPEIDRINVLGDQRGRELIRIGWKGDGWKLSAQHDIPYNDKSGMYFKNFPDGVNTIDFSFDDKDRWISEIVYEFQYTMFQSGPIRDPDYDSKGNPIPWRPGLCFIGKDDYFNNFEFKSGWTHHGMTVGNPLFYPVGTMNRSWNPAGMVLGVENNRLKAHHIGIGGKLFLKYPYRLMLTYSRCYGTYFNPYTEPSQADREWGTVKETPLHQFSGGFNCMIPVLGGKLQILPGIYADAGQVLGNSFAATLGLKWIIAAD